MKKTISILTSFYLFALTSVTARAADGVLPITGRIESPIEAQSVSQILLAFFGILIQIGAVAVTLAIVYAGFLFVAAQGNPEKINQAKTTLFYTIIGALVLLGAQVIAQVVQSTITQLS